jgi:Domain of unknown function (DUF4279)
VRERVYKEAHASVRLTGEDLDPLEVTLALRLPADHVHRRGEPRLQRTRSGVREYAPYRHGQWSMSTQGMVQSRRLSTHIEWLLSELEPKANALRSVLNGNVDADIFCYSLGASSRPPSIPRSIRDRASALGLRVDIDHYSTLDDD